MYKTKLWEKSAFELFTTWFHEFHIPSSRFSWIIKFIFIFQVELLRWFTCFVMLKIKLLGKSLRMYSAKCLVINWWVPKSGLLCPSSYPKSSLMLWKGINYSNFMYLKYNKHRLYNLSHTVNSDPKKYILKPKLTFSWYYVNQLFSAPYNVQKVQFWICFAHENLKKT